MAITFPITWPTHIGPMAARFRSVTVVGISESDFTKQQQITKWPGERWEIDFDYPPMERDNARILIGALTSLRGREGTFYFGPRGNERNPSGTAAGASITVNGASQSGPSILLAGWSGTLQVGDYLEVTHTDFKRLYMCLTDTAATGAIDIFPSLRTPSPANGAAATFNNPVGLFRLLSGGGWDIDRAQHYGIQFTAMEAI